MGTLQQDGKTFHLLPWTALGRAPGATIRLDDPRVSGAHAVVSWSEAWQIQDLGSRNGTFHNGQRLEAGQRPALSAGDRLRFGAEGPELVLTDDSAPVAMALPAGGGAPVLAAQGLLSLPNADAPVAQVFEDQERWFFESEGGTLRPVQSGDWVTVAGGRFQLSLPAAWVSTREGDQRLQLGLCTLVFGVSPDEEHVDLHLQQGPQRLELPHRAHHYTLLTLARSRLRDRAAGVAPGEEGWEDPERLARRLGLSTNAFFVQLCRARAQLAEAGVEGASGLIERRAGGKLRLAATELRLDRGEAAPPTTR